MSNWQHFRRDEFKCRGAGCCGGSNLIAGDFVDKLDALREACGFALRVTSGYRCAVHNHRVSSTGATGPHTTGRAADLGVDRYRAYVVLKHAMAMGFTGIGVQQKGGARFIHLDTLENGPGQVRPTCWSY